MSATAATAATLVLLHIAALCGPAWGLACTNVPCGSNSLCRELSSSNTNHVAQGRLCRCESTDYHGETEDNDCADIDECNGPCVVERIRHDFVGTGQQLANGLWASGDNSYSVVTSCGGQGTVLGGHDKLREGDELHTTLQSLSTHAELHVKATVVAIDAWDDDVFNLFVDGTLVFTSQPQTFNPSPYVFGGNDCGDGTLDPGIVVLHARVPHNANTAEIEITTSLELNDQSWGLIDFQATTFTAGPCHTCGPDTVCNNTRGGFDCTCKPGFSGDGVTCQDDCVDNSVQEAFSASATPTGWSIRQSGGSLTSTRGCGSHPRHLGGFNKLGRRTTLEKTFTGLARHRTISIRASFLAIDSWDNEVIEVYADGILIGETDRISHISGTNRCGNNEFSEHVVDLTTPPFNHEADSITLWMGSTNDQGLDDESWGLISVEMILEGIQGACPGIDEVCATEEVIGTTCSCLPGLAGIPCFDVDECAASPCARTEIAERFEFGVMPTGWPVSIVTMCGYLPPVLGGFGALTTQTMSKTYAGLAAHSSVSIQVQLVLIDTWDANTDRIEVDVDGQFRVRTPARAASPTGAFMCGSSNDRDPGMVIVTVPEMAHTASSLVLAIVPVRDGPANGAWGIAGVTITLDPSASPGCNECSKPHMVCGNELGGSTCECEEGYYLLGGECIDTDECAIQNISLSYGFDLEETGSGFIDAARGVGLSQRSDCGGVAMLGGFGLLGQFAIPERTFEALPPHTALTVTVTLFIIDSWDAETVTMLVDGQALDDGTFQMPSSTDGVNRCGDPSFNDIGEVVLSGRLNHKLSNATLRLETTLASLATDESFGIVSVEIVLHNDDCGPVGTGCTNTDGAYICTCPVNYATSADGRSCETLICPGFDEVEQNGFNLTGCAEGHAVNNPLCTVDCVTGTSGATGQLICVAGGQWELVGSPLCFEYEPKPNATAGAPYTGPILRTNLNPGTADLVAIMSTTNLDSADSAFVSNDPGDFGSVKALFSPAVSRTGPVLAQINMTYGNEIGQDHLVVLPEFEIEVLPPITSSGSRQFAFAGQAFIGQEPGITGGSAPYSFSLHSGALPDGYTINDKGTILGTTEDVGDFSGVVVQATDANGATFSLEPVNFRIIPALEVSTNDSATLATAVETVEYAQSFTFAVSGGSGAVTYLARGTLVPGLVVDEGTGAIRGFPRPGSAQATPYTFRIVASDESGIEVVALEAGLLVEPKPDCDDPSNGPNGQGCGTGLCVDETAFDGQFTCNCTGTGLEGDNCQLVDSADAAVGSSTTGLSPAVTGSLGALAGLVVLLVAVALLVRRAQVRARNKPFDFQAELERMREEGLVSIIPHGEEGKRVPRELKRGNVRLLDKLGAGQFGDVFKGTVDDSAETGVPEYLVAVKTLKGDPTSKEMTELMREAALMAQFRHRNVVNIVGVCTKGEPYYLVVQFCENGALNEYLKKRDGPLKEATVVRMAHDIATGMEYLAGAGLVHRDLAARNVLLDSHLVCKVADFGMSRDVDTGDKDYYRAGTRGMVPIRWTAPEALEEQVFSQKTDVWAWGITVYEMLTGGAMPYKGWSNQKVWVNVKAGHRLECPGGFDEGLYREVVLPCWHAEPADRPTFAQLASLLEARCVPSVAALLDVRAQNNYASSMGASEDASAYEMPQSCAGAAEGDGGAPSAPRYDDGGAAAADPSRAAAGSVSGAAGPIGLEDQRPASATAAYDLALRMSEGNFTPAPAVLYELAHPAADDANDGSDASSDEECWTNDVSAGYLTLQPSGRRARALGSLSAGVGGADGRNLPPPRVAADGIRAADVANL